MALLAADQLGDSGSTATTTTTTSTVTQPSGEVAPLTVSYTFTDTNGNVIQVMSDGSQQNLGPSFDLVLYQQQQLMMQQQLAAQQASQAQYAAMSAEAAAQKQQYQQDAIANLQSVFESYGLGTLAPKIAEYVRAGYSSDTVAMLLQDTAEYKQRFAGNEARRKAGMAVLSPAEYLATERAYRQILSSSGLPEGYYDSYTDFAGFISNDVSPTELKQRVDTAAQVIQNSDPFVLNELQQYYGLDRGTMIAHVLDPKAALPFIQRQVQAAQFGAEAQRQGLQVGVGTAEQYANMGISQQQAQAGFSAIGQMLPTADVLSQIYGVQYGQQQAMQEVFANSAEAAAARKKLSALELGSFAGQSGIGAGSLRTGTEGQF